MKTQDVAWTQGHRRGPDVLCPNDRVLGSSIPWLLVTNPQGWLKLARVQHSTRIRALLAEGVGRTLKNVAEVVNTVLDRPALVPHLVRCLFDTDEGVRLRAADALEKMSRVEAVLLQPYVALLLGLFAETDQKDVLWHLAVLLPRLHLSGEERSRTVGILERCLEAKSSLVRTFALQGLTDLASKDRSLTLLALERLRAAERSGTPAMKARSRKLLATIERRETKG